MDGFFNHPAVQGGVAPFVAGLAVVAILGRVQLGGLAVVAAFATAVALISGLDFTPLTAMRKVVLLALLAPALGIAIDITLRPGRTVVTAIALACGVLTVWVFWSVLRQKTGAEALLLGGGTALFIAWLVGATMALSDKPVRAGAAALMLGLGAGISAILGASALLGLYGIALGAGAGAFLLWQMMTGQRLAAGATFTVSAAVAAGLVAAAALVLAKVPWQALVALGAIPLAVRLPAPDLLPVWLQAFIVSAYGLAAAFVAFVLTWPTGAGPAG